MDPTTLVTFLFKAPLGCRVVELIGSWDNFTHPYTMFHDRRRGQGLWTGCFKFHNIICDGDRTDWARPRHGGLKQGGTYWYYYRLDDDAEAIDRNQPVTSHCPLMPGMMVNMLEVPVEVMSPPSRCRSASAGAPSMLQSLRSMQTLDPDDKYNALERPPVTKVHRYCASDLALSGRLESESFKIVEEPVSPPASSFTNTPGRPQPVDSRPSKRVCLDRPLTRDSTQSPRSWHSIPEPSVCPSVSSYSMAAGYLGDDQSVASAHSVSDFPLPPTILVEDAGAKRPTTRQGEEVGAGYDFRLWNMWEDALTFPDDACSLSANSDSASMAPRSIHDIQFVGKDRYEADEHDYSCTSFYQHPQRQLASARPFTASTSNQEHTEQFLSMPTLPSELEDRTSPYSENGAFDIWSPTFSAATVSSGGLNTPFRLSGGNSSTNTALIHNDGLDDIAARLERLGTMGVGVEAAASPQPCGKAFTVTNEAMRSLKSIFSGYSLSSHDARSDTTPAKASNGALPRLSISLHLSLGVEKEISMADAIFGELGYLSGSIKEL